MKLHFTVVLSFLFISFIAQKGDDVRRTIGFCFPTTPLNISGQFYQQKVGLQYRQCFRGFVFQVELNRLFQKESPALYERKKEGKYSYAIEEVHYDENTQNLQRYLNTQFSLSKGWTNDRINLYLGLGISLSKSKLSYSSQIHEYYASIDSTGKPIILSDYSDNSISLSADYLHVGVVAKASVEMKLLNRTTLLLQFSPEISGSWRQSTNKPELSKRKYSTLTSSLIEVGIHYRL